MYIFHFYLIDLDLWNAFCEVSPCEVSPWGSFLFTLQRQKKVCTPGDEAIMKIHKKLFSGIPINFTFFVISSKLQRIWSWNFGFATRNIWAFISYEKCRPTTSGWALGDENVIGIRYFNNIVPVYWVVTIFLNKDRHLKLCFVKAKTNKSSCPISVWTSSFKNPYCYHKKCQRCKYPLWCKVCKFPKSYL